MAKIFDITVNVKTEIIEKILSAIPDRFNVIEDVEDEWDRGFMTGWNACMDLIAENLRELNEIED